MTAVGPSRVVVIGAGMAGLTAARLLAEAGHVVSVLDKGRRAGGRMATRALAGGAFADHGAQFFTGDGYGGSRIEGAFLSGRAAADAVLKRSV